MSFNRYQELAEKTAIYPKEGKVIYPALELAGEAGETVNKIKKLIRDNKIAPGILITEKIPLAFFLDIQQELGDVLWYISALASDLNMSLDTIARVNIDKLKDRKKRDKIKGEGDGR